MARRNNEDVSIWARCEIDSCPNADEPVQIEGRYDAEGEFEAFDENDLLCESCDSLLVFDDDEA